MKKIILLLVLLLSIQSQSQTYVKVNALTTLLTIPNVGIETSIGKNLLFRLIFWASFEINKWLPLNSMFNSEYRYHFNENMMDFMLGSILADLFIKF
jgi:hypothetical protein